MKTEEKIREIAGSEDLPANGPSTSQLTDRELRVRP
jgi:hypothetical protein